MGESIVDARQPYIDGRFVAGGGAPLDVENPATEEVVCTVETAALEQFELAVTAARGAFDHGRWGRPGPAAREERIDAVLGLARYFEEHYDQISRTLTAESGAVTSMIAAAHLRTPLDHIGDIIQMYRNLPDEEHNPRPLAEVVKTGRVAASIVRHEPVGVVSAITAYNVPFWINIWKVIPALITGNTVVLRPSPMTPLSALVFGQAAEAAGLPPGVLNVVLEAGTSGAELMTTHPAVDQVTFTGSTVVGRQIMKQSADTVKRLMLELGGKSVQIYLPDSVGRAAFGGMLVCAGTAGQACVAPTRMLVPEAQKAEVLEASAKQLAGLRIGDPSDPATMVGPLISAAQRDRCQRYVDEAVRRGAGLVIGGGRPKEIDRGYYFEPTILDVPDNSHPVAQEEIFGPVLCVLGYRDLDDAVDIANRSSYGLAGQVFGADLPVAVDVAERLRTGAVSVNGGATSAYASSGGYKQSGLGRERGREGIRAYQQIKHLSVAAQ